MASAPGTGLPDFEGDAFFMGGTGAGPAAPKNLWVAAADGEVDTVRAHLDAGVSPGAPDENGYTACHAAASYGHVPVLELLLARGGVCWPPRFPRCARRPRLADGALPLPCGDACGQGPLTPGTRTGTPHCTRRRRRP